MLPRLPCSPQDATLGEMSARKYALSIPARAALSCALALSTAACRDATSSGSTVSAIAPNSVGANGCSGPDQVFTAPQTPAMVPLSVLVIDPGSQITAARGSEVLYATGAGATIVAIDVSAAAAQETELVGAGTVATLLTTSGVAAPPELSGIAVLDDDHLVVVESTSNTLLVVDRVLTDTVGFFAGQPTTIPGFADGLAIGPAGLARFSFVGPTQICPSSDDPQRVFVADAGNHAVRMITTQGPVGSEVRTVSTIAGAGLPGYADGDLSEALFDTPTGLSATCGGTLIVSEMGGFGFGQRLRELDIGPQSLFGGFLGVSQPLAGDGVAATTEGQALVASVSVPVSPLATQDGEIYWVDSGTGVLRRMLADATVDCPLAVDCTTAVATPSFPPGHAFSLTETDGGKLFVLDATAGVLYRVTP